MMAISSSDMLKAADRVWGMLDHLAEHNPQEYRKFVDKQLAEGREMFAVPQPAEGVWACSPRKNFKIRHSEIASEAIFGPKMLLESPRL